MHSKPYPWLVTGLAVISLSLILVSLATARGVQEAGRTFLVDRTGERWDIYQAVSIGFDPHHFEFGIGRHAFQALDENDWSSDFRDSGSSMRVIGVAGNGDAHAYAVNKLRYHETANTFLGAQPIVAGY